MDTALPQKFPFILDRNLAKANCTGNHVCTSCDKVVLDIYIIKTQRIQLFHPNLTDLTYVYSPNIINLDIVLSLKAHQILIYDFACSL